jgi:diadenosine tetraphosphatase ApaH/serine/threonine PP2A family protein phosphatase
MLAPEMRRFLADLPRFQRFSLNGSTCVACHSTAKNKEPLQARPGLPSKLWPWESDLILVGHFEEPFVFVGHPNLLFLAYAHSPLKVDWMDTVIVNPGSVGKPLDGDPRAPYAVWEDGAVSLRRAEYDVEETVHAYDPLPLDDCFRSRLIEELRTGGRVREQPPAEMAVGR